MFNFYVYQAIYFKQTIQSFLKVMLPWLVTNLVESYHLLLNDISFFDSYAYYVNTVLIRCLLVGCKNSKLL